MMDEFSHHHHSQPQRLMSLKMCCSLFWKRIFVCTCFPHIFHTIHTIEGKPNFTLGSFLAPFCCCCLNIPPTKCNNAIPIIGVSTKVILALLQARKPENFTYNSAAKISLKYRDKLCYQVTTSKTEVANIFQHLIGSIVFVPNV